jgi:signal recognition particle subunit SRP54
LKIFFENISNKFQKIFESINKKTRLSEKDIEQTLNDVKNTFLDADVNLEVARNFIKKIKEKIINQNIINSLTPSQHIIKFVNDELVNDLGSIQSKLSFSNNLTIYMMVGLQGSGKTTHACKLAVYLKKINKKVMLVACDIYRPAAVNQLKILGENNNVFVFFKENKSPVEIAELSTEYALKNNFDCVLIDTAGRLNVDENMMNELKEIKRKVWPQEIFLVVDSMMGQEAANVAKDFNNTVGIDSVIMTKLDSDTKGGSILSITSVTKKPIKFIGTGEKVSDLEEFFPDRIASRILGMGDVVGVIEKIEKNIDIKKTVKTFTKKDFDLQDFYDQMQSLKKLGSSKNFMSMIPGFSQMIGKSQLDDKAFFRNSAIILSMTPKERANPDIINGPRKKRISLGSGQKINDVNILLKKFNDFKKILKMFGNNKKSIFDMFGK